MSENGPITLKDIAATHGRTAAEVMTKIMNYDLRQSDARFRLQMAHGTASWVIGMIREHDGDVAAFVAECARVAAIPSKEYAGLADLPLLPPEPPVETPEILAAIAAFHAQVETEAPVDAEMVLEPDWDRMMDKRREVHARLLAELPDEVRATMDRRREARNTRIIAGVNGVRSKRFPRGKPLTDLEAARRWAVDHNIDWTDFGAE